jgi:hypothetical protein
MRRGAWIFKFLVFGILALGLIGLLTQTLWNWLVPELFHGPSLTFWQAVGLLALSKILFWTFGRGRGHWGGGHWRHRGAPWGYYWSEKWKNMSEEDRAKFKQKMNEKWGCSPRDTSTADSGVSNV